MDEIEIESKIPRCFSRGKTLRRGYCCKMIKVWTDFGRTDIDSSIIISLQWEKGM